MIRQHGRHRHVLNQIVIITGDDKTKDVTMSVCSFLDMLPEIGRSKNLNQLFDICIPQQSQCILKSPKINKWPLLVERESTNSEKPLRKSKSACGFHTSKNHGEECRLAHLSYESATIFWSETLPVSQVSVMTRASTSISLTTSAISSNLLQID